MSGERKRRLIAGTINSWPDDGEWVNFHLDVSDRGIWSRELDMTVQPDFVCDLASMPIFRDGMFDEVRAHHVLEHLAPDHAVMALAEVLRVLVPGGVLDVETPDIDRVCHAYVAGELDQDGLAQWLYGEQLPNHETSDSHRSLWTVDTLGRALRDHGFVSGQPIDAGYATRYRAVKP